jgi:hypothetical protein
MAAQNKCGNVNTERVAKILTYLEVYDNGNDCDEMDVSWCKSDHICWNSEKRKLTPKGQSSRNITNQTVFKKYYKVHDTTQILEPVDIHIHYLVQ